MCIRDRVDRGIGISGVGTAQAMVGLAFTHSSSDFGNILMDCLLYTSSDRDVSSEEILEAASKILT